MNTIVKNSLLVILTLTSFWGIYQWGQMSAVEAQMTARLNTQPQLHTNAFIELAKTINPVVVNISTSMAPRQTQRPGENRFGPRDPFFELFESLMDPQFRQMQIRPQQSLGTGFIIRKDGLILTNNHVVEQADVIQVQLSGQDKTFYEARIIGKDQRTDVALIKIEPKKDLPFARLGESKNLQVGEIVAAFGNPYGHSFSMTQGIVSAIGREISEINRFSFIQTDASINPGNSGGPLVNLHGEVIGVNTAIDARAQGIGFAIPIDEIKSILPILEKGGEIQRGFLGVAFYPGALHPQALRELNLPNQNGALIASVEPNSPAEKAGLKEYDFITRFGNREITDGASLQRAVQDANLNQAYTVEFIRDGKRRETQVTLTRRPQDSSASSRRESQSSLPSGKEAPHKLGFKVANLSVEMAQRMGLRINRPAPIVVQVDPRGPAARAGLRQGDIIVDVNRNKTSNDNQVISQLRPNQVNSIRIFRGELPMLLYIEPR